MKLYMMKLKFLFLFVTGFSFWVSCCDAQELTAREIIKKADDKTRGNSSEGEMTMTIVRTGWERSVTMKFWSLGTDYSMVLITSPAKEKGQSFLKIKKEMWNWVPSINRMIKIPPSMMMQSWMGSDFTNDDLVKESSILHDYEHTLLGKEMVNGKTCYKIQLIALPDAPVVWGKILVWITCDGFDQWKGEYYDEEGELVNTMTASEIRRFGDREMPSKSEIVPAGKNGQKTVLIISKMIFDKPIDQGFFSQQNMKKLK